MTKSLILLNSCLKVSDVLFGLRLIALSAMSWNFFCHDAKWTPMPGTTHWIYSVRFDDHCSTKQWPVGTGAGHCRGGTNCPHRKLVPERRHRDSHQRKQSVGTSFDLSLCSQDLWWFPDGFAISFQPLLNILIGVLLSQHLVRKTQRHHKEREYATQRN